MGSFWTTVVTGVGIIAALAAAAFWLLSSLNAVPNNQDTFIIALQKMLRLNSYAAMAAAVAAICALGVFLFGQK